MPRTALIVPVRAFDAYYDGAPGVPAHVTVLFPFVDGDAVDEEAVASVLASFGAFPFTLASRERFADGVRWLRPEPSEPFRLLTQAVWRRWPECPPYEGAHDDVIPHLTVTRDDAPVPVDARAEEVWLIEEGSRGWRTRRAFPLAQGVA
jgi:2'-5' RNA ligase